jgi:hypothetical protein
MQTLRRERKQKFNKIISVWVADSPAITDVTGDALLLEEEIGKLSELLANASISEGEKRTDEERAIYKTTKEDLAKTSVEAAIFGGLEVSQETVDREKFERAATSAIEAAFGITRPWDWWNIKKEWRDLLKLVVDEFRTDSEVFKRYVAWYDDKGKFAGGMNATQIKRDPDLFSTAWDMFKRQDKPASTPQYKPLPEDKNIYVPNPNRRTG